MVEAALHILISGSFPSGFIHTHITLIPKKELAIKVLYFKPISLCNVIYKLIFKVIDNRLKLVLPSIIFESQSAFVLKKNRLAIIF